jgi:hypothetical protein
MALENVFDSSSTLSQNSIGVREICFFLLLYKELFSHM